MTKAEEWLYTETAPHLRNKKIAVIHEAGHVHIRRVIHTTLSQFQGNYVVRPLGSGKTFEAAYRDARKRGKIKREV